MTTETAASTSTKAYSYLRFSTPEQAAGDSFRRQYQMAVSYALAKGLELDDKLTFHDLGRSGFRGQNVETGQLGAFLEAIRSGEVPQGSFLLVESLDRISRQNARRALRVLEDIADQGITVVTLNDGRQYSKESLDRDPTDLLLSILQFMRANEESATKARRLKEAWANKRRKAVENKTPLTGVIPAWLRLNRELGRVELIPERAAVVERIFRDTLRGVGQHLIASRLNADGVKPWGRGAFWHRSYIYKILTNANVIGTMTPQTLDYVDGKRTRTPQDPIKGYYPAAIPEDLWLDVQAMKAGKVSGRRGVHAANPVTQMLARLALCPICGSSMARVNKGSRCRPSLVCSRARTKAGCSYKSVRIDLLEDAIAERLPERLRNAPAGERDPEVDRQIINLEEALSRITAELENTLDTIKQGVGGEGRAVLRLVDRLEGEYEETRDTLRRLEAQRAEVAGQTVQSRIGRLLGTLEPSEGDPLDVSAVNAAMLTVFRGVTVDYRQGVLEFEWLHGGSVGLPYALPLP